MSIFNAPIALAIAVLVVLFAVVFVILKARGSSLTERRPPTRFQVAFSVVATAILVGLWLKYDFSMAIFPAIMIPVWIPLLARNQQASSRPKLLVVALLAGTISLVVVTGLFVFLKN